MSVCPSYAYSVKYEPRALEDFYFYYYYYYCYYYYYYYWWA